MTLLLRAMIFALAISGSRNGYAQGDPASPSPVRRISGAGGVFFALGAVDELQQASSSIGIRGGLMFGKRLLLGIQFSATGATLAPSVASSEVSLQVNENGLWAQYAVTRSRTVQPFVGLQLGRGKATWTRSNADMYDGTRPRGDAQVIPGISVITPSIGVHFNGCTWFRPDLVLGYRVVDGIELGTLSSTVMNGPFIGINVLFGGFRQ